MVLHFLNFTYTDNDLSIVNLLVVQCFDFTHVGVQISLDSFIPCKNLLLVVIYMPKSVFPLNNHDYSCSSYLELEESIWTAPQVGPTGAMTVVKINSEISFPRPNVNSVCLPYVWNCPSVDEINNLYFCIHVRWATLVHSNFLFEYTEFSDITQRLGRKPLHQESKIMLQSQCASIIRQNSLHSGDLTWMFCTLNKPHDFPTLDLDNVGSPLVCRKKDDKERRWYLYGLLMDQLPNVDLFGSICPHITAIRSQVRLPAILRLPFVLG